MASDVERLAALFAGSTHGHGTHGEPTQEPGSVKWAIKLTAKTLRGAPTLQMWEDHVAGKRPLGVIPIREDNCCKWASIDVDTYDGSILELVNRAERARLPLVPCQSKSGGLHLYLFLREWTPCSSVLAGLKRIAAGLGIANAEIFPKQTQLAHGNLDLGNWILAPYFGSTYGGKLKEQVGLTPTGGEMTLQRFLDVAEGVMVRLEDLPSIKPPRSAPKTNGQTDPETPFGNGPPCLQHLIAHKLLGDGRKRTLFHMGVYYKKADPEHWREAIESANQEFMDPPLSSEEVSGVVRSLGKKDYQYKCKESPMADHCDSLTCRGRAFGVGEGASIPVITTIRKLKTTPPRYFVTIDGDITLELGVDDLLTYHLFNRAAFAKLDYSFTPMKAADWVTTVNNAMRNVHYIDAPDNASLHGEFQELLDGFLTDRSTAKRYEDLPQGRPWFDELGERDEKNHSPGFWFQVHSFVDYLKREKAAKEFEDRTFIYTRIRDLGGYSCDKKIKGKNRTYWFVPADKIARAPTLDPPAAPEMHI